VSHTRVSANFNLLILLETFDSYIVEELCERASQLSFKQLFKTPGLNEFFDLHSGAILSKKALRLNTPKNAIINFVRQTVASLPQIHWTDILEPEQQRLRYTRLICALMTVHGNTVLHDLLVRDKAAVSRFITRSSPESDVIPALAAAIGDVDVLFQNITGYSDILTLAYDLFPNALNAAVASGQLDVIRATLKHLDKNARGKRDSGSWDEMRAAAHAIGKAAKLAIRLREKDAGLAVFNFLDQNPVFADSMPRKFDEELVSDCLKHGNTDYFYLALKYNALRARSPLTKIWSLAYSGQATGRFWP
jgi:hypothetical protein